MTENTESTESLIRDVIISKKKKGFKVYEFDSGIRDDNTRMILRKSGERCSKEHPESLVCRIYLTNDIDPGCENEASWAVMYKRE